MTEARFNLLKSELKLGLRTTEEYRKELEEAILEADAEMDELIVENMTIPELEHEVSPYLVSGYERESMPELSTERGELDPREGVGATGADGADADQAGDDGSDGGNGSGERGGCTEGGSADADGSGENAAESKAGDSSGKGNGEGQGEGDGEGQGEGEREDQDQGEGEGAGESESSQPQDGTDNGDGEGQGEGERKRNTRDKVKELLKQNMKDIKIVLPQIRRKGSEWTDA